MKQYQWARTEPDEMGHLASEGWRVVPGMLITHPEYGSACEVLMERDVPTEAVEIPRADELTFIVEWSPQDKLDVLKAMGFTAMWEQHQPDCPSQFDSGMRCNCIPPGTSWVAPHEVKEFMNETYEKLRERRS